MDRIPPQAARLFLLYSFLIPPRSPRTRRATITVPPVNVHPTEQQTIGPRVNEGIPERFVAEIYRARVNSNCTSRPTNATSNCLVFDPFSLRRSFNAETEAQIPRKMVKASGSRRTIRPRFSRIASRETRLLRTREPTARRYFRVD